TLFRSASIISAVIPRGLAPGKPFVLTVNARDDRAVTGITVKYLGKIQTIKAIGVGKKAESFTVKLTAPNAGKKKIEITALDGSKDRGKVKALMVDVSAAIARLKKIAADKKQVATARQRVEANQKMVLARKMADQKRQAALLRSRADQKRALTLSKNKTSADKRREVDLSQRQADADHSKLTNFSKNTEFSGNGLPSERIDRGNANTSIPQDTGEAGSRFDIAAVETAISQVGKHPGMLGGGSSDEITAGQRAGGSSWNSPYDSGMVDQAANQLAASVTHAGSEAQATSDAALQEGLVNPSDLGSGQAKKDKAKFGLNEGERQGAGAGVNLAQVASDADTSHRNSLVSRRGLQSGGENTDGAVEDNPGAEPDEESEPSNTESTDTVSNIGTVANVVIVVAKGAGAAAKAAGPVATAVDVIDIVPKLVKDAQA
ncbi:MAG: hypothetical protein R8K20_00740, partial [Gallionellaceae bacterium]